MRFSVLGPLSLTTDAGAPVAVAGDRQRGLLAILVAQANQVVSADALVDQLWGDQPPANPTAALQSQVSRLRKTLTSAEAAGTWDLVTHPPGYSLHIRPDSLDVSRFEHLMEEAQQAADPVTRITALDEALDQWQGSAYAEFADYDTTRLEAIRLDELRSGAIEDRAEALLEAGRAREVLPVLEPFVAAHPLRERARATLMKALYAMGRQPDALRQYASYRHVLGEELGLEPSGAIQRLEADILDHRLELAGAPAPRPASATGSAPAPSFSGLDRLDVRYLKLPDGKRIAYGRVGSGPPIVAVPAWISSLDIIAAGRDPRSSLIDRLALDHEVILYDRWGTGMSRGEVDDFSFEYNAQELEWVLEHLDQRVTLLGVSQAGPAALTVAHRRPELVDNLILFGTYASGPLVFPDDDLKRSVVAMVRAHWGMAAGMLAPLYRPGASSEATQMLGRVLRESAPADVVAGLLEQLYGVDVAHLLPDIEQPALVLHYQADRLIHYRGGQQLATELPNARFLPLEGRYHLPDAADLDRIVAAICDLVG